MPTPELSSDLLIEARASLPSPREARAATLECERDYAAAISSGIQRLEKAFGRRAEAPSSSPPAQWNETDSDALKQKLDGRIEAGKQLSQTFYQARQQIAQWREALSAMPVDKPEDLQNLCAQAAALADQIFLCKGMYRAAKELRHEIQSLHCAYAAACTRELGCESASQVGALSSDLETNAMQLRWCLLGLGKWIYRSRIAELQARADEAAAVVRMGDAGPLELEVDLRLLSRVEYGLDNPQSWPGEVLTILAAKLDQAGGLLWQKISSYAGPESLDFEETRVVESLVHDCREELLLRVRDELVKRSRGPFPLEQPLCAGDTNWRSYPLMVRAGEVLDQVLSFSAYNPAVSRAEPSAVMQQILSFPQGLLGSVSRHLCCRSEESPRAVFQQFVWWTGSCRAREAAARVRTVMRQTIGDFWRLAQGCGVSFFRHDNLENWLDLPYRINCKLQLEKEQAVLNVLSQDLWGVVSGNRDLKDYAAQACGLSAADLTRLVAKTCIRILFDRDLEGAHRTAGEFLLQVPDAEFIPVNLLNCYRANSGGRHQFIDCAANSAKSPLAKYAMSLPQKELSALERAGVPGAAEIIRLIKDNLATFDSTEVQDGETWVPNPIHAAIREQLERLAGHILRTAGERACSFVLELIKHEELRLTPDTAAGLGRVLESTGEPAVLELAANFLNATEQPATVFRPVFYALCRRAGEVRHEPQIMAPLLLAAGRIALSEQDREELAALLDLPVPRALRILNLARALSGPGAPRSCHFFAGVYRDVLDLSKGGAATEIIEDLLLAKAKISADLVREIRALELEPETLQQTAAAAKAYAEYLVGTAEKLGSDKQFWFINSEGKLLSLLKLGPARLLNLKQAEMPPAFLFGAVAQMPAEGLSPALCAQFGSFKALRPLFSDRYALERLVTVLSEEPSEKVALLQEIISRFPELPRAAAPKLLTLLHSAHIFRGQSLLQKTHDSLPAGAEPTFDQFAGAFREQVLQAMGTKYPKRLLTALAEEDLDRFMAVYPSYEISLKHFGAQERVAMVRVLAVVEMLGRETDWLLHSGELAAVLRASAAEFFPEASEREAALAYLDAHARSSSIEALFPKEKFTAEEIAVALTNWHQAEDSYDQVITDASMEDKLLSVRNLLGSMFHRAHLSEPFRIIHQLAPGINPQAELGQEWRRIKAALQGAGSAGDREVLGERLAQVEEQQRRLKEWEGLRKIGQRYERATSDLIDQIAALRLKLGEHRETIEALGFSFNDSFRERVFSGEVQLLRGAIAEELAARPAGSPERELKEIAGVLDQMESVFAKSWNYLQSIRPGLEESLQKLQRRRVIIEQLIARIEQLSQAGKALKEVRAILPEFNDYGRRVVHECREPDKALPRLVEALGCYKDPIAEADLQNTLGVVSDAAAADAEIFTIRQEKVFSRMLEALQGQCLDFRLSRNNIGNSVYLPSLQDGFRMLAVGFDEAQKPRLNAVASLMPVAVEGRNKGPAIVLDRSYVSDGSALSWSKFEGLLEFLLLKSRRINLPLVLPQPTYDEFRDRLLLLLEERGIECRQTAADFDVLVGPTGGTYLEIEGFDSYSRDSTVKQNCLVINIP